MKNKLPAIKKKDYYVTLDGGNCSIVRSSSKKLANTYARKLFGTIMTPHIQEATPEQVSWVKAMGGRVHEIE
jgi:hypothetical protein